MTVYQEAHEKIDKFPEETVYLFVQLMDKMALAKPTMEKASGKTSKLLGATGKTDEKTINRGRDTREAAVKELAGLWKTYST